MSELRFTQSGKVRVCIPLGWNAPAIYLQKVFQNEHRQGCETIKKVLAVRSVHEQRVALPLELKKCKSIIFIKTKDGTIIVQSNDGDDLE